MLLHCFLMDVSRDNIMYQSSLPWAFVENNIFIKALLPYGLGLLHFREDITIRAYPYYQVLAYLMIYVLLEVPQAAFAVACFWGLSDAHGCSGGL